MTPPAGSLLAALFEVLQSQSQNGLPITSQRQELWEGGFPESSLSHQPTLIRSLSPDKNKQNFSALKPRPESLLWVIFSCFEKIESVFSCLLYQMHVIFMQFAVNKGNVLFVLAPVSLEENNH